MTNRLGDYCPVTVPPFRSIIDANSAKSMLGYCTPAKSIPLKQNLIRLLLLFRQPLKSFIREQSRDEGVNDLLQREHE